MTEGNFDHLPLILRTKGDARLRGGGKEAGQTTKNKENRKAHRDALWELTNAAIENWKEIQRTREAAGGPVIPSGMPLLLEVDPNLRLEDLRDKFSFEIVADQDDGFVIIATEDFEVEAFLQMVDLFASDTPRGSSTIAKVHHLFEDPKDRLRRVLSEQLAKDWETADDAQTYIVDIGIACEGLIEVPAVPVRRRKEADDAWNARRVAWSHARDEAYQAWDDLKREREEELEAIVRHYKGEILCDTSDGNHSRVPSSFTLRLKVTWQGLRDLALNYPYVFEIVEPDDIELPQQKDRRVVEDDGTPPSGPPDSVAPSVCVIDSGIQHQHVLLAPAMGEARCFLPGKPADDVFDEVRPDGHGTRVAGTVLFGEEVHEMEKLPFWIENARVLDADNRMPHNLFPPEALRKAVLHFHEGEKRTRIFNHSINSRSPCRMTFMSAWAAEADAIVFEHDVLIIQSVGNVVDRHPAPLLGFGDHILAGREYPGYLLEPSCRIANPAQSLNILTVGSVAYGGFAEGDWRSIADQSGSPSAFSRAGFGIWNTIKPEVVEYGGDWLRSGGQQPSFTESGPIPASCPELVRSTAIEAAPQVARDRSGTSFAAPKVTHLAGLLHALFPSEPTSLYRALIVHSARWPEQGEQLLAELRGLSPRRRLERQRRDELLPVATAVFRSIGYGIPDEERATTNSLNRVTLISGGNTIAARECQIFEVPIPPEVRFGADEIRVDVTLAYSAQPRRTRRGTRGYQAVWLTWISSKLGESIEAFQARALREIDHAPDEAADGIAWTVQDMRGSGLLRDVRRSAGTVQKDWAVVEANSLPEQFCIGVVGHQGWSKDPDAEVQYSLVVSFEAIDAEAQIYEPIRAAVEIVEAEVKGG